MSAVTTAGAPGHEPPHPLRQLRWLLAGAGGLVGVLLLGLAALAAVWLLFGQQSLEDRIVMVWLNWSLVLAFAAGGWFSSRFRAVRPRESVTAGLIVATYGLVLLLLALVVAGEFWLDPITDFRSFMIQMGLEDPAGTPPTDFYGDPTLQPPDTAYDKLFGFVGYLLTLTGLLYLASVLGAVSAADPERGE